MTLGILETDILPTDGPEFKRALRVMVGATKPWEHRGEGIQGRLLKESKYGSQGCSQVKGVWTWLWKGSGDGRFPPVRIPE